MPALRACNDVLPQRRSSAQGPARGGCCGSCGGEGWAALPPAAPHPAAAPHEIGRAGLVRSSGRREVEALEV